MKVLVTGSKGFVGRNLVAHLREHSRFEVLEYSRSNSENELETLVKQADKIVHLAGVNRPKKESEFKTGNQDFTAKIVELASQSNKRPHILLSSSSQAELNNLYGESKLGAEKEVLKYREQTGSSITIYRLPNLFGKWSRPNYNSAIATFCYNMANDLEIKVTDPSIELNLAYIDDVVDSIVNNLLSDNNGENDTYVTVPVTYKKTLKEIVKLIKSFKNMRESLLLPNYQDLFVKKLYTTYLSYLDENAFSYSLIKHEDNRGWLSELIKSDYMGQMFLSKTKWVLHEEIIIITQRWKNLSSSVVKQ
ncbi:NAD-dependent epimerase/dehydratase family protein [Exiguobacterium sp. SL14]|nr:NAD-dependent epimerase/dehydratase family protein [Exiguobacterium sp. SL14]MCY1689900.1 NAD-dependent epimerase/dehydratase family protein [Exiguobacterium sp. SL14]